MGLNSAFKGLGVNIVSRPYCSGVYQWRRKIPVVDIDRGMRCDRTQPQWDYKKSILSTGVSIALHPQVSGKGTSTCIEVIRYIFRFWGTKAHPSMYTLSGSLAFSYEMSHWIKETNVDHKAIAQTHWRGLIHFIILFFYYLSLSVKK